MVDTLYYDAMLFLVINKFFKMLLRFDLTLMIKMGHDYRRVI